jgi:hypothetical protein
MSWRGIVVCVCLGALVVGWSVSATGGDPPVVVLFGSDPMDPTTGIKVTEYYVADDFELSGNGFATDLSFVLGDWNGSFPMVFDGIVRWWIYLDDGGVPGQLYAHGAAWQVSYWDVTPPSGSVYAACYEVNLLLGQVVELESGVRYWLAFNVNQGLDPSELFSWVKSQPSYFAPAHYHDGASGWIASTIDLSFSVVQDPASWHYIFADGFVTGDLSVWSASME